MQTIKACERKTSLTCLNLLHGDCPWHRHGHHLLHDLLHLAGDVAVASHLHGHGDGHRLGHPHLHRGGHGPVNDALHHLRSKGRCLPQRDGTRMGGTKKKKDKEANTRVNGVGTGLVTTFCTVTSTMTCCGTGTVTGQSTWRFTTLGTL